MKLSKIKIIALILTLFMAASLILSCGGKDAGKTADNSPTKDEVLDSESGQDATVEEKSGKNSVGARPDYNLPDQNFNGYTFRIISRSETANLHWWNNDIFAEEENGDPINDAVYARNKKVEERYNIEIKNIHENDVGGKATKSIKAGSDDYDMVVIGLNGGQENLTVSGLLSDLRNMPYVDLTKPWWDQKAVDQLSIHNKLFATSCDITVRDKDAIIILMFSKTLAKNQGLEDPYQLVLSGNWTLDKMYNMVKNAAKDINGDGKMDLDDQYGFLTQYKHAKYLFNAGGEYVSKLNADKVPEITLYNERAAELCQKIKEMQGDKNITMHAEQANGKFADIWDQFQVPMFAEDRALFYHAGMNRVTLLRTMETDFGILPPPKYDDKQENYYVSVDCWCTSAVSVPITVSDKEKTGLIVETLAYESRYILLPAYYDINLKTKFARDEESSAMIDIILANRLYDLQDMYGWGSAGSFFDGLAQNKGDSLATFWEKNGLKIEAAMQKTVDKLDNID